MPVDVISSDVSSVLDQYARPEEPQTNSNELGRDAFLRLLVSQMENQNPLEPQENGEFVAQMAQFSSLEGIENLNTTMEGFVSSYQSNLALEATALVGRQVQVNTDTAWLQPGEPFTGVVQLPISSPDVRLNIYDDGGQLVRDEFMGSMTAGDQPLLWDGTDSEGQPLPSGLYTVRVQARIDGENQQLNTLLGANVNSVTLGTNAGDTTVNLAGIGEVNLRDVKTIQ